MTQELFSWYENRQYFFKLEPSSTKDQVQIMMYNTLYTFVKKPEGWRNHDSNKMELAQGLLEEVIKTIMA
ncbi:hypothetical protein [Deminuibacter soli]|uniref:Uncharacterized protein n=1 Tax=Deminuibacter soli TaxID=2291815 RepID=A0A3E1NH52_9BACT|nr:hypothetical protein [Deminuibacter soli]RFM27273.1 hypothetical protein DXN05_14670 [Deminuibacter soli]